MATRKVLLSGALLLSIAASIWAVQQPQDDKAAAVVRPKLGERGSEAGKSVDTAIVKRPLGSGVFEPLRAIEARRIDDEGVDLFRVPEPLLPKVVVRASSTADTPPAKAAPPPMPWRYAGRFIADNQTYVLLSAVSKDITVKQGDVIDGQYRVDAIEAGGISLTYLPLNELQRIPAGENG